MERMSCTCMQIVKILNLVKTQKKKKIISCNFPWFLLFLSHSRSTATHSLASFPRNLFTHRTIVQLHRSAEKPMNTKWTAIAPWPYTPLGDLEQSITSMSFQNIPLKTSLYILGVMKIKNKTHKMSSFNKTAGVCCQNGWKRSSKFKHWLRAV